MFICNKCLKCKEPHFSGSHGPCEVCGKVRDCHDCPPYHQKES